MSESLDATQTYSYLSSHPRTWNFQGHKVSAGSERFFYLHLRLRLPYYPRESVAQGLVEKPADRPKTSRRYLVLELFHEAHHVG